MVKILLVEDDNSLREIYSTRLAAEGYQIIQAGNGEDGLAQAVAYSPDLIVSDAMMPKISGFEMLDLLKGNEKTRNIKVIMMTALSADGQKIRGEKLGADRYLVKSQVGIEDLVRVVHDVLLGETTSENPAAPQSEQPDQNVQQIAPQLQPAQAGQAQVAPSNQPQSQNQPAPVTPIQQQPQPVQAVSNPSNQAFMPQNQPNPAPQQAFPQTLDATIPPVPMSVPALSAQPNTNSGAVIGQQDALNEILSRPIQAIDPVAQIPQSQPAQQQIPQPQPQQIQQPQPIFAVSPQTDLPPVSIPNRNIVANPEKPFVNPNGADPLSNISNIPREDEKAQQSQQTQQGYFANSAAPNAFDGEQQNAQMAQFNQDAQMHSAGGTSRVISPLPQDESLNPRINIDDLLVKEEASEMGFHLNKNAVPSNLPQQSAAPGPQIDEADIFSQSNSANASMFNNNNGEQ